MTATCRQTSDTQTLPSAPSGLVLFGSDVSIILNWNNNPIDESVTSFKIYRATNQGGPFTLLGSVTTITKTDSTALASTFYWYRVSAVNAGGEGPYTEISGFYYGDTTPPANPTILTGPLQIGQHATELTWAAPVDSDFAGNKFYTKDGTSAYTLASGSSLITSNLYDHILATAGHTWTYKITSVDRAGNESTGTVSSPIAIPSSDTTPPQVPVNLVALGRSDGNFLTWDSVPDYDIANYLIYTDGAGYSMGNNIGTAGITPTSFLDTNAVVGTDTGYEITAIDTTGNESGFSAESRATRLDTSVNSLSFLNVGTMAPCVAHARGIDYRRYTAVDANNISTVTLEETDDFLPITNGNLLTANYQWNFASTAGQSKGLWSTLKGFNAAHVYDSPGKYDIKLTRTDIKGKIDTFTASINVAPDTRTKIYCTPFGDNSNSNNGQNSAFPVTVNRAQSILATSDNITIVLQNGQAYNTTGTLFTLGRTNQMITSMSYGGSTSTIPALCQFNLAPTQGPRSMFKVLSSALNPVIQNLTISRSYTPSGDSQSQSDQGVEIIGPTNTLIRKITFLKSGTGVVCDNVNRTTRYVLMQECTGPNRDSINQYLCFVTGQDMVFLGNTVVNSLRAHVLRLSQHSRTLVAYNNLTDGDHGQLDQFDVVRTPLSIQQGVDFYAYANTLSADITATDSTPGLSKTLGAVSAGALREGNGHRDQYLLNCVLEANTINAKIDVQTGTSGLMIRNNIIDRTDSQNVNINGLSGNDEAGLPYNRVTTNVSILNNTIRDNGKTGTLFRIGDAIDNLEIVNNHGLAANIGTNPTVALVADFTHGFGTNNIVQRNCFPLCDNYRVNSVVQTLAVFNLRSQCGGLNTKENTTVDTTYKPASNSTAATFARPKPGVYDDVKNNSRPQAATTWTCGAYQL